MEGSEDVTILRQRQNTKNEIDIPIIQTKSTTQLETASSAVAATLANPADVQNRGVAPPLLSSSKSSSKDEISNAEKTYERIQMPKPKEIVPEEIGNLKF
jgi:hypothetical protein